jgi:hypothetical protein
MNIIDTVGYTALILNLISMSMKNLLNLRLISLIANVIYIYYSIMISATPMIIGSVIAFILHGYGIFMIVRKTKADRGTKCVQVIKKHE